ncbi:MAG: ComEC/Rec2 family competence protein [Terracidiphilus sp.]
MHADIPNTGSPAVGLTTVPLFHAAWIFALGIVAASALWLRPSFVLIALPLVAALCCAAAFRAQRIAWLPLAVLWLLLGAWCAEMQPQPAPAPALDALSDGLLRTVEGTVIDAGPVRSETEQNVDEPFVTAPSQLVDLRVASLEVVTDAKDSQEPVAGGVRLTIRWPEGAAAPQPFRCGERIGAIARLLPPELYRDPGVWSRTGYLLGQGITSSSSVRFADVERLGHSRGAMLACRISRWQHATTARLLALPAAMKNLPPALRLTPDDAAMLAAMVAGDRTYLTHELRVGFERTGSFHMLVVSGFHLAIVAGCIFWIVRRLRLPRLPATLVTIFGSFAYALFTGFATPVQRSLWMITLYLLGRLVYRERNAMNVIGFAALCLLVVSPRSLFDASFQMTLLAVVVIAGIAVPLLRGTIHPYLTATRGLRLIAMDVKLEPRLAQFRVTLRMFATALQRSVHPHRRAAREPRLTTIDDNSGPQFALFRQTLRAAAVGIRTAIYGRFSRSLGWTVFPWAVRFLLRVAELLIVSCVVELAMTLPMAVYFHRITLFALPVNMLILPLLAVLMPAALLMLLMLVVWPAAAIIPAMVVAVALHIGVGLVHLFGSMALGDFRIPTPLLWQSAAFCLLLGTAIALVVRGRWARCAACAAMLLAALAAVVPRPVERPHGALLMEAIDVGQGDSLLLITPDGKTLLVDGGGFGGGARYAPQNYDIGEDVVSPTLWARGIRHLDAVALTHTDSDHMGGLPAVLRNFHPDALWVGENAPIPRYRALLAEAAALHIPVRSYLAGDTFPFGVAQVRVFSPFRGAPVSRAHANDNMLVLRVAYGATSVLLEGDAEAPVEQAMLAEPGLQSTLLKVGHHGSITSTRPAFLARVSPRWAVISCGLHNRYGHPREEVLNELQTADVRTYITAVNGITCFRLNGKTITPEPECGLFGPR